MDHRLALGAAIISSLARQAFKDLFGDLFCVAANADRDFFGQPDSVRVYVDLNNLGVFWPIINAIAWKR